MRGLRKTRVNLYRRTPPAQSENSTFRPTTPEPPFETWRGTTYVGKKATSIASATQTRSGLNEADGVLELQRTGGLRRMNSSTDSRSHLVICKRLLLTHPWTVPGIIHPGSKRVIRLSRGWLHLHQS